MSHRARTHRPGGLYYTLLSSSGGRKLFLEEEDKNRFTAVLAEVLKRYNARLHAYCWSDLEARLLVEVSTSPLGLIIQTVAARHARSINLRANQTGHLFHHPYRAFLLEDPQRAIEAVRHIHSAPAHHTPPANPANYRWSSHRAYLGIDEPPQWLTTGHILQALTVDRSLQRAAYRQLFDPPSQQPLREQRPTEERFLQHPATPDIPQHQASYPRPDPAGRLPHPQHHARGSPV